MEFEPGPDLEVEASPITPGSDSQPRHLSPSSSNLYQQCARKWRFRYLDRLPDPPGVPALVGTFAHLVLEHLLQHPEGQRSQDQAKRLARSLWPEFEREPDYQALGLTEADAKDFRWKSWIAIEGLWALENPDETEVHATEHEIQVDIGGVPFRGIIDRVDVIERGDHKHLVVSDYKSGKAPAQRFRNRPLKQVLLYAAALESATGQRPFGARLLYLGQRTMGVRVTEANLAASVEELQGTWESLNADWSRGEFDATTGPLCAWCPFLHACAEGQAEVRERSEAGNVRADAPGLAVIYAEAG
ncbi:MAG: PD-(D/E)XK nuclease family protein [Actinomycetota bacterium]